VSPLLIGVLIAVVLIVLLLLGTPVAFALGCVSVVFVVLFEGVGGLDGFAETLFGGLNEFALLSIPMFILMGAAIASSRAGSDLYEALERWLYRVPGGLLISNLGACSIFAALSGSSPATCAAIGKMGIPEMKKRGYPDGLATGAIAAGGTLGILIPPSITMIVYGIATQTSIGRLLVARETGRPAKDPAILAGHHRNPVGTLWRCCHSFGSGGGRCHVEHYPGDHHLSHDSSG
jgi:C4-dicarboxylate transporter DctM subunit